MDLAIIGRLFTSGKFDARKTIRSQVRKLKSLLTTKPFWGAKIGCIVNGKLKNQVHQRIISGNVLTGYKVTEENYLGFIIIW